MWLLRGHVAATKEWAVKVDCWEKLNAYPQRLRIITSAGTRASQTKTSPDY